MLRSEGVGLMVWSPLAGGLLSGKYGRDRQGEEGSRRISFDFPPANRERAYACIDVMRPIAQSHGVSVAQIALAWLLHQPQVTSVIVGAKRPEQLAENIALTQVALSQEQLRQLDEVSALPPNTRVGCSRGRAKIGASRWTRKGRRRWRPRLARPPGIGTAFRYFLDAW